jgi:(1->4)-alpha-D-glucan 1-alpha-D-glucosylmutase
MPPPAHRPLPTAHSAPDPNEEYLLYQTLVGVWPFNPADAAKENVVERVQASLQKAMREAKVNTSWTDVNSQHEQAVDRFIADVLDEQTNPEFFSDFLPFQQRVSRLEMINSLAQSLLRLAAPGVPDTYQGTELWDLSLVDPDNRRPVDYARRAGLLTELQSVTDKSGPGAVATDVLQSPADGRVKFYTTWRALTARRSHPGLFSAGHYVPIDLTGARAQHVFAFARITRDAAALVVVPRLCGGLDVPDEGWPIGPGVWQDTRLMLPPALAGRSFRNVFTGASLSADVAGLSVEAAEAISSFPVALWIAETP